jgi:hypothetical protein
MSQISTLEDLLVDAEANLALARRRVDELRRELDVERLKAASSNDLIGKRVSRTIKSWRRGNNRTERGTVAAYDPSKHSGLRCLRNYGLKAGDLIVVHDSGRTGWRMQNEPYPFELVEDGPTSSKGVGKRLARPTPRRGI